MTEANATFGDQRARAPSGAGPSEPSRDALPSDGPAQNDPRPTARWPTRAERELEYRTVLAELDAIHRILGVPAEPGALVPRAPARASSPAPEGVEGLPPLGDARGAPSPYLDDRLASAREAAAGISTEFEAIQRRTQGLGDSVATLRAELDRAAEELSFLRAGPGVDSRSGSGPAAVPPNSLPKGRTGSPTTPGPIPVGGEPTPPAYAAFTVARYNETVGEARD
ncbi:MAG: hypothetical protein L3J81_06220, partial [Thermoplasmata archaeon]|nr:hypothetical protein [Thermoplasmata archaeon]